MCIFEVLIVFFSALHWMPARTSDEKSVRPSVCLSVRLTNVCLVTKRKKNLSRYHTKDYLAYFLKRRIVGKGRPLLREILGQRAPSSSSSSTQGRGGRSVRSPRGPDPERSWGRLQWTNHSLNRSGAARW